MKLRYSIIALAIALASPAALARAKEAAMLANESAVVTFMNGSYELSLEDAAKIKKAIQDAQTKGKIEKAEIAVWSDKDHPDRGSLPLADKKLAEERIQTMRNAIKQDMPQLSYVKAYNMASNSNWLGRNFHSDEAKLDKVFAKKSKGQWDPDTTWGPTD